MKNKSSNSQAILRENVYLVIERFKHKGEKVCCTFSEECKCRFLMFSEDLPVCVYNFEDLLYNENDSVIPYDECPLWEIE